MLMALMEEYVIPRRRLVSFPAMSHQPLHAGLARLRNFNRKAVLLWGKGDAPTT